MLLFEEEQFPGPFCVCVPFTYSLCFESMVERSSVSYSEMQQEKIGGVGMVGMMDRESLTSPDVNILTKCPEFGFHAANSYHPGKYRLDVTPDLPTGPLGISLCSEQKEHELG